MPAPDEQLTLFAGSVRDTPAATPHRRLSQRERELLVRWCGTDNHPLIVDAINLFNATIVDIVPTKNYSRYVANTGSSEQPQSGRAQPATKTGQSKDK
jgi:hypothetical protein